MSATRRLNWRIVLGIWSCLGVLLIFQSYISVIDPDERTWLYHAYRWVAQMYRAWLWAAMTPVVLDLNREILRRHRSAFVIGALHLLAALTILAWGNIMRIWAIELTFGYWDLKMFTLDSVVDQLGVFTLVDFYLYWVLLGAGYGYELFQKKREAEQREAQLGTLLAQAELAALKQQVQPHFLFNSLNAVSSLMREGESAKAVEALALLSTLLRQLMNYAGRTEIELWREFDYAQCYLAIEKVRFEDKLITHFDADEECLNALVPTLILQPLVENAVKHGIAQRRNPGRVTVTARRVGDQLQLTVANDPAEGGHQVREGENHGIGLSTTRHRLDRTYGAKHKLTSVFNGPEGTRITFEVPLVPASLPA